MLISEEYREQQQKLHARGDYGITAEKYGGFISDMVDKLEVNSLLDFGCGSNLSLQRTLRPSRPFRMHLYDPGVPEYADDPHPAELVVACDVLEHIEPEYLEDTLDLIEDLTEIAFFASVHMGPAGKTLEDGRNAHLIQEDPGFWLPKFMERFTLQTFQLVSPVEFFIIAQNSALDIEPSSHTHG